MLDRRNGRGRARHKDREQTVADVFFFEICSRSFGVMSMMSQKPVVCSMILLERIFNTLFRGSQKPVPEKL